MITKLNTVILQLWVTSRVALSGLLPTKYDRMVYIKRELVKHYPDLITAHTPKQLWVHIDECVSLLKNT
jgi:hypothetical protein